MSNFVPLSIVLVDTHYDSPGVEDTFPESLYPLGKKKDINTTLKMLLDYLYAMTDLVVAEHPKQAEEEMWEDYELGRVSGSRYKLKNVKKISNSLVCCSTPGNHPSEVGLMVICPKSNADRIRNGIERVGKALRKEYGIGEISLSEFFEDMPEILVKIAKGEPLHREDGPAFSYKARYTGFGERPKKKDSFFINGKNVSREEYEKHFEIKESKFGKLVNESK